MRYAMAGTPVGVAHLPGCECDECSELAEEITVIRAAGPALRPSQQGLRALAAYASEDGARAARDSLPYFQAVDAEPTTGVRRRGTSPYALEVDVRDTVPVRRAR